MIFWTLLLSSLSVMIILYLLWGHKKIWFIVVSYGILAFLAGYLIKIFFPGLYRLDLLAFLIPYLLLFPIHFSTLYIVNNYVLHDDKVVSKYLIAIYNRILFILWGFLIVLLIGIGLALWDALFNQFSAENIWSMSVTGFCSLIVLYGISSFGYKKIFSYILVVGKTNKQVYILRTNKSRLSVDKTLNVDYLYPRGIYSENHQIQYLYYLDQDIDMSKTDFEPYESELYEVLKNNIESYEKLEEVYTEYIERKSSIS